MNIKYFLIVIILLLIGMLKHLAVYVKLYQGTSDQSAPEPNYFYCHWESDSLTQEILTNNVVEPQSQLKLQPTAV